jgi:hypothetical protein
MRRITVALLFLVAACQGDRVHWEAPQATLADTLGAVALDGDVVSFVRSPVTLAPDDPMGCPGSAVSTTNGASIYAAWLRRRPNSSVLVLASRSDDGGQRWTAPAIVDSVDVGIVGCARPRPSIAVSAEDGYVHVAYSLKAPEGYGVFFAHSMDRAATFHSPMIIVYGDRLAATAIAAHGMRVAVAYEDPSGKARRVDVALSETQGHTFEPRERGSPDEMTATRPRIAIQDTVVALSFAGLDSTARAVRIGRITRD